MFDSEKTMENFVVEQEYFYDGLDEYQVLERQFGFSDNIIDVLAYCENKDTYLIIELKNVPCDDNALTQTMRYLEGFRSMLEVQNSNSKAIAWLVGPSCRCVDSLALVQPDIRFGKILVSVGIEPLNYVSTSDFVDCVKNIKIPKGKAENGNIQKD